MLHLLTPPFSRWSLPLLIIAQFLVNLLAIFMVFCNVNIPNSWLALYSVALVLIWHIYLVLPEKVIEILTSHKTYKTWIIILAILASTFAYVGIICAYASYHLPPRSIFQDILAVVMYSTAFVFDILLWYLCYRLCHHKKLTIALSRYLAEFKKRQDSIQEWKDSFKANQSKKISSQNLSTKINTLKYFSRRWFYIILWVIIPLWIFVIIPIISFNTILEIPWYYIMYMAITITSLVIWLFSLLKESCTSYHLTPDEITIQHWWRMQKISWLQFNLVIVDHESLQIYLTNHHKIVIPLLELRSNDSFVMYLQNYLPLGIWVIRYEGWNLLSLILNDSQFKTFQNQYQNFCQIKLDNSPQS